MVKFLLSGIFFMLVSCGQSHRNYNMEIKPIYREGFIHGQEVNLQYLDWGGSGQPLILLHGLGDSPFLFEDIAISLKKDFRIIAYARRGHCKSVSNASGYDTSDLVEDLKLLLDSLKINKASLLGWSMGGNEITEFAIRYPERTNKLIYLEAGYDLSETPFKAILQQIPQSPFPDSSDLSSIAEYRKWYHNFWFRDVAWNSALESNLRATTRIHPDGSVETVPNDSISRLLLESATRYRRNYVQVKAQALAIFTKPFFVPPVDDEHVVSLYEKLEKNIILPWRISSMDRIRTELKNSTIIEMPLGSHASLVFLSKDVLVESIQSFLLRRK